MRFRLAAVLAIALCVASTRAESQALKVVVPFPAGGSADHVGRVLSEGLNAKGISTVVENRAGAGGTLGSRSVAKGQADGKSVLIGQIGSHVLSTIGRPELGYEPEKDFSPVILLGYVPTLLAVRPGLNVKSLQEFVDKAKTANPPLNFGSSGRGTSGHVTVELLKQNAKIDMTHIPYTGIAPIMTDMLGGRIDSMVGEAPGLRPQIGAGLQALVIIGPKRTPLLPDVPTTAEAGFPDWNVQSWYGVFVASGTPEAQRAELEKTFLDLVKQPDVAAKLQAAGLTDPGPSTELKKILDSEFKRWPAVFRQLGLLP